MHHLFNIAKKLRFWWHQYGLNQGGISWAELIMLANLPWDAHLSGNPACVLLQVPLEVTCCMHFQPISKGWISNCKKIFLAFRVSMVTTGFGNGEGVSGVLSKSRWPSFLANFCFAPALTAYLFSILEKHANWNIVRIYFMRKNVAKNLGEIEVTYLGSKNKNKNCWK